MFALTKKMRGKWHYLTHAGRFSQATSAAWAMDSTTARKALKRHKDCEIVLILANNHRPALARAGNAALVLLLGVSAMSAGVVYALHCAASFAQLFTF